VPTFQQRLDAIANHPDLPRAVIFFEDITSYQTLFTHSPLEMPNKFTAGAHIYKDASLQNVIAVVSDIRHPVSGDYIGNLYAVYNAKPSLHAEMIHPILQNIGNIPNIQVMVNYNAVVAAMNDPNYQIPSLASNNPYG